MCLIDNPLTIISGYYNYDYYEVGNKPNQMFILLQNTRAQGYLCLAALIKNPLFRSFRLGFLDNDKLTFLT